MPIPPMNAKTASAWENMVASVCTTMRIRRAPGPSPSTLELLEKSSNPDPKPSMVGPVLLALVFISFAVLCYSLSLIWEHQEKDIFRLFTWVAILAASAGGSIILMSLVGILRDR